MFTMILELCPRLDDIRVARDRETNWMDTPYIPEIIQYDLEFNRRIDDVYLVIAKNVVQKYGSNDAWPTNCGAVVVISSYFLARCTL